MSGRGPASLAAFSRSSMASACTQGRRGGRQQGWTSAQSLRERREKGEGEGRKAGMAALKCLPVSGTRLFGPPLGGVLQRRQGIAGALTGPKRREEGGEAAWRRSTACCLRAVDWHQHSRHPDG